MGSSFPFLTPVIDQARSVRLTAKPDRRCRSTASVQAGSLPGVHPSPAKTKWQSLSCVGLVSLGDEVVGETLDGGRGVTGDLRLAVVTDDDGLLSLGNGDAVSTL